MTLDVQMWQVAQADDGEPREVTELELRQELSAGSLPLATLVRPLGSAGWVAVSEAEALSSRLSRPSHAARTAEVVAQDTARPEVPRLTPSPAWRGGGQRSSYIGRHWRGELPLGRSYWINGLLLSAMFGLSSVAFGRVDFTEHPRLLMGLSVAITLLALPVTVWQYVGIWRSAGRRRRERRAIGRSAPWALIARGLTVLGCVYVVGNLFAYQAPNIWARLNLALGRDSTPPHRLRLLAGGTELELTGGMGFGTASEFEALLDVSPGVRLVHLDSVGGRVAEGNRLKALISEHKLATYTGTLCASACTVAYLGGSPRYLGPGAKLAFHRFSFPGLTPFQEDVINQDGEQTLLAAGIPRDFTRKAFSTPSNDLWMPDAAVLMAAHVVTNTSNGMAFAATNGGRPFGTKEAEAALDVASSVVALKQWDRASYDQMVGLYVAGVERADRLQDVVAGTRVPLLAAVNKYAQRAPDEVQVRKARLVAASSRALAPDYPEDCVAALFGTTILGHSDYSILVAPNLQQQEVDVTAAIIIGGASAPSDVVATKETAKAELARLWTQVRNGGTDLGILGRKPETDADQRSLCLALSSFFEGVAALPPQRAGALLRYLQQNKS